MGRTRERTLMNTTDVLLVNMPFASALVPSIALGLLKAGLNRSGIDARAMYPSLRFAEIIGFPIYKSISNSEVITNSDLVGEWIFSSAMIDQSEEEVQEYVDQVLLKNSPAYQAHNYKPKRLTDQIIHELIHVRSQVGPFLNECLESVLTARPKVVAFTSVFQQQMASLALAKNIKEQEPEAKIVFGGANCDNLMGLELVRQFSFVDAVVSGEGDVVFPEIVKRMLSGSAFADIPGVFTRDNIDWIVSGKQFNTERVRSMDAVPVPDYDDYFEALKTCTIEFDTANQPRLLMETSRGCWWGERSHCTFCGLNADTMAYSSKSAPRALAELDELTAKYPGRALSMVDNILDMKYFKDFLPALAKKNLPLDIFYEIKANLKKEQLATLRDAGVTMLQPGVESFSSSVLGLMGKGVKGIMNIQLLKWSKEHGITPFWNVLWGFPGEDPAEYGKIAALMPSLHHLQPPVGTGTIRLDRFSPNFNRADELGFINVRPYPAYRYVYKGLPEEAVFNLSYFFTFDYKKSQDVPVYTKPVFDAVQDWKRNHATSGLFCVEKDGKLELWDSRTCAVQPMTIVDGLERHLYEFCDGIKTLAQIKEYFSPLDGRQDESHLPKILDGFVERRWMIREGNSYMSLAIAAGKYEPKPAILQKLVWLLTKEIPEEPFPEEQIPEMF